MKKGDPEEEIEGERKREMKNREKQNQISHASPIPPTNK